MRLWVPTLWMVAACDDGWPGGIEGEWELSAWSVEAQELTGDTYVDEAIDAGTVRFEGTGEWWESEVSWSGPEVIRVGERWYTVPGETWGYWTIEGGDLHLIWHHDYSAPEVFVLDESSDPDVVSGTSTVTDTLLLVIHHYTLSRVAP